MCAGWIHPHGQHARIGQHAERVGNATERQCVCVYVCVRCFVGNAVNGRYSSSGAQVDVLCSVHVHRRRVSVGGDDWRRVHGGEWIAAAQRRQTHRRDLQHGAGPVRPSVSLHDSSSSWRDAQAACWNTHRAVRCRSVSAPPSPTCRDLTSPSSAAQPKVGL